MSLEDIQKIKYAIDDTGLLSNSQKIILKYLISFNIDRGVSSSSIMDYLEITKQAINFSLKQLMKRGFVCRNKDRVFVYKVNLGRMHELVEDFDKKLKLKQN